MDDTYKQLDMPLKKAALFLSGVGYYEHESTAVGNAKAIFSFKLEDMNDALKSLIVIDPSSVGPVIAYSGDEEPSTGREWFLSNESTGFAELMNAYRGAAIEVSARETLKGRIIGVEERASASQTGERITELILFLLADSPAESAFSQRGSEVGFLSRAESESKAESAPEIRVVFAREIRAWRFLEPAIAEALNAELDKVAAKLQNSSKPVCISLPAKQDAERQASIGYVIGSPVWKASYRLDLSESSQLLQAWAIVDNASNSDWNGIELSLLSGKPSSFIIDLYSRKMPQRPVVEVKDDPAIVRVFEDAFMPMASPDNEMDGFAVGRSSAPSARGRSAGIGFSHDAPTAKKAGEQFAFTVNSPVSLAKGDSSMFPLFSGEIKGSKASVYPADTRTGDEINPSLCFEIENSSPTPLPAGSVVVYDDEAYAGDALLEYIPEHGKRLISYGEDQSVSIVSRQENAGNASITAAIASGVARIYTTRQYEKSYLIRNKAGRPKRIVIEHLFQANAKLIAPSSPYEKTASAYRFAVAVAPRAEQNFAVKEEVTVSESFSLGTAKSSQLAEYSERGLPKKALDALKKAASLLSEAESIVEDINRAIQIRDDETASQERIRSNIVAAGRETEQGKEFLGKLSDSEKQIEQLESRIQALRKQHEKAQATYSDYVYRLAIS